MFPQTDGVFEKIITFNFTHKRWFFNICNITEIKAMNNKKILKKMSEILSSSGDIEKVVSRHGNFTTWL